MTGDSVKSRQSVPHAWNIVNIGEEPYQLDVTDNDMISAINCAEKIENFVRDKIGN